MLIGNVSIIVVVVIAFYPSADFYHASTYVEMFDASPKVSLQCEFQVLDVISGSGENNSFQLIIKPILIDFKELTELKLTVIVERFEKYFAWTNMTMDFKFFPNVIGLFPTEAQTVNSSTHKKFFTRVDETYKCESRIPIPMGPHVTIVFSDMTFQAFEAETDPPANRQQDVRSKRLHHPGSNRTNVTACDALGTDGTQELLAPGPLTRIVTMCREDLTQLCTLIEFRGHLHVFYPLDANETGCHTVPLDIRSASEREASGPYTSGPNQFQSIGRGGNQSDTAGNPVEPEVERVLTTGEDCCTIYTRCFIIPLGKTLEDPLYGWRLHLTWERTPEAYEFGEVGWSSVGAPIGSLSGVYDLVQVHLTYRLSEKAGFPSLPFNLNDQLFSVSSFARERFQARVGDYYECISTTNIVLEPNANDTVFAWEEKSVEMEPTLQLPGFRVILTMTDVRSQAFADVNVPEFTGASE
ncbi:unnamed protein product [Echinostoma caproni]|uniref:CUB domain-containing protein n=1 Tax=Echinostoma caproni TaxID=27848 RepID=A0A183AB43_9TREM|nr:unnamed protein product [Echinostoma caproni]